MKTVCGMVSEIPKKKCVITKQNKFYKLKKVKKILMKLNSVWINMLVNTEYTAFKEKVLSYLI